MNESGELFTHFCAGNHFVIGGNNFSHKIKRKATLISPNHNTENH